MFDVIDHAWAVWVVAALVAAVLEITLPSLSFSFASIGAMVAALVSLYFGWEAQAIVFSVTSIGSLLLLRTRLIKRFHFANKIPSRADALLGFKGEVTESIESSGLNGRVLVAGEDWAARSKSSIAVGKTVVVENSDGIVLIVKEI